MFEASVIPKAQTERRRVLCESLRVRLPRSSLPRPTPYTESGRSATSRQAPARRKEAPGHAKCPGASCIRQRPASTAYEIVIGISGPSTDVPPSITSRISVVLPESRPVTTRRSDPLTAALACWPVRTRGWRE